MKNVFAFLIALALISSCAYSKKNIMPSTGDANSTMAVSYSLEIKPIIVTYCLGTGGQTCHVTPSNEGANGDFTTYGGLYAKVINGSIQSRVFSANASMPPSYSSGPTQLSPADKTKFMAWVNNGAPNN
jgi:hypothetical protein